MAVKTFHSASTALPNMVGAEATVPEGNSVTTPPDESVSIAARRMAIPFFWASSSCGKGTGIWKLAAISSISVRIERTRIL